MGRVGRCGIVLMLAAGLVVSWGLPPAFAVIPSGNVLALDGVDDYAGLADNPSVDLGVGDGEDVTIEAFFYVPDETSDANQIIVWKQYAYAVVVNFNTETDDALFFRFWTCPSNLCELTLLNSTALTTGWHHVAAVFDNEFTADEDRAVIYLDGVEFASTTAFDASPGLYNAANPLSVGANSGAASFDGWLEEIRFSDTVRYTGAYTVPTSAFAPDGNTRALWHFDDVACATSFEDASGNGNTLTAYNGASTLDPDPTTPSLQFSSDTYVASESGGPATITVTRTGDATATVGVDYATSDGSATAGTDYTANSGTLSFGCGETSKTFDVLIQPDNDPEGDETVELTLSAPTGGAVLGDPATAILTISSDGTPPSSAISFPQHGATYTAQTYAAGCADGTPDVCGTAADDAGGSGVAQVEVSVQRASDGYHFDGGGWQTSEMWLPAAGADAWSYGFAPEPGTYTLKARATDGAGNVESTSTATFTVQDGGGGGEFTAKVLGGPAAVAPSVVEEIGQVTGVVPQRVAGADRYETAAAVVADAFPGTVGTVYVATGAGFADALAGSAAAAAADAPVLLVRPDALPEAIRAQLQRLQPGAVKVLGGPAAVAPSVVEEIGQVTGVVPQRVAGADRYETAAAVVADAFPGTVGTVYVATGAGFADALAGSAAAAAADAPVLLVKPDALPEVIRTELQRLSAR